jgi:hypothetical protein
MPDDRTRSSLQNIMFENTGDNGFPFTVITE